MTLQRVAALAIKRAFDIVAAAAGLLLSSPLMILAWVRIRREIGSPILFRHRRVGLNKKEFTLLKFRTMSDARDSFGGLLSDEERLVPVGCWLRRTSIDELPQFWNVFKGDMSLVGPRPLLVQYLPRYNAMQRRRHEAKPGITGWAQVNGRNTLTWEQKLELDIWYVDHWSLLLDMKILWMTIFRVIRHEGIAQDGHATMPEFMGSKLESDGNRP